jgi:Delta3-Delta2-enoyl-CoA isomerase
MAPSDEVTLQIKGKIAIITLNIPKKLNAMNQDLYFRLATLMHEVAGMNDVVITILTGNGRFFSA